MNKVYITCSIIFMLERISCQRDAEEYINGCILEIQKEAPRIPFRSSDLQVKSTNVSTKSMAILKAGSVRFVPFSGSLESDSSLKRRLLV